MIPVRMNGAWTLDLPDHRAQWANPRERLERLSSMCDLLTDRVTRTTSAARKGTCPLLRRGVAGVVMVEPDPRV